MSGFAPFKVMLGQGSAPSNSLKFDLDGSEDSIYMSDTDFGKSSMHATKLVIAGWFKFNSTLDTAISFLDMPASGYSSLQINFSATNYIDFAFTSSGATPLANCRTAAGTVTDNTWEHFYFVYDSGQATSSDRIKIYKNGAEVSYDAPTTLLPGLDISLDTGWTQIKIGCMTNANSTNNDLLLYNFGVYSGSNIPTVAAAYRAKDCRMLPGLISYLNVNGGNVLDDGKLTANWTNVSSTTSSTDKPTGF